MTAAFTVVGVLPDSPEWSEERRRSLGCSDLPAILGVSRYKDDTQAAVFDSKKGIDRHFDPERAWHGHRMEAVMADWLRHFHPEVGEILPAQMIRSVKHPWLHASLDRRAAVGDVVAPVQMKTQISFARKEWEDGVPDDVQVQVQGEMLVLGAPHGWVVVSIDGRYALHKITRDAAVQRQIVKIGGAWWKNHVLADVRPLPSTYAEAVAAFPGIDGRDYALTDEEFQKLEQRDVDASDQYYLKKRLDAFKEWIAVAVGDATRLTYQGRPVYTYKRQFGARQTDIERLEAEHPRWYRQLEHEGIITRPRYPVLRLIKKKETPDGE